MGNITLNEIYSIRLDNIISSLLELTFIRQEDAVELANYIKSRIFDFDIQGSSPLIETNLTTASKISNDRLFRSSMPIITNVMPIKQLDAQWIYINNQFDISKFIDVLHVIFEKRNVQTIVGSNQEQALIGIVNIPNVKNHNLLKPDSLLKAKLDLNINCRELKELICNPKDRHLIDDYINDSGTSGYSQSGGLDIEIYDSKYMPRGIAVAGKFSSYWKNFVSTIDFKLTDSDYYENNILEVKLNTINCFLDESAIVKLHF